jgi:pimeloyl-ACP methyl ester carboxylesterase
MKLVLLPGLDGTGDLFTPFIQALEGIDCEVIRYPPDRAMSYADHEAYAHERLPRGQPFVLLGESFSGPVAISVAAGRPADLRGMILCCSFVCNPLPLFGPLGRLIGAAPALKLPARLFAPWLYGSQATSELRRAHARAMSSVAASTLRSRVAAVLAVDYRDRLRQIEVPTLYLQATRDRLVPRSALQVIQRIRNDIQVAGIEGPHFLLQTRAPKCAAIVSNFLASLS